MVSFDNFPWFYSTVRHGRNGEHFNIRQVASSAREKALRGVGRLFLHVLLRNSHGLPRGRIPVRDLQLLLGWVVSYFDRYIRVSASQLCLWLVLLIATSECLLFVYVYG